MFCYFAQIFEKQFQARLLVCLFRYLPVYKNNQLIGAVAVFRDISAQQQTQTQLHEALAQVKHLSEQLKDENDYLIAELNEDWQDSGLVGRSDVFQRMLDQIQLVSETDSTVLILGENGTGKELVARNLHRLSKRNEQAFIKVNCAAFTPSLLESELFGHERGSFTGANERRKGRFELADHGTLFLDEVAELPLESQSKLLRVLQEREFERVGGSQTLKVDIRIIAATNRNLWEMVQAGQFRMAEQFGKNSLSAYQASQRGGKLYCEVGDTTVTLTGHAVRYLKGTIYL